MKIYVLSVLLVRIEGNKEEVRSSEPIAAYTDYKNAIAELNRYVDESETNNGIYPSLRLFRKKDEVSGSAEDVCDNEDVGVKWKTTVFLKTLDTEKKINFTDEIGSLW